MRAIAYLVNQYPLPSHTFIRREICALEAMGWTVARYSHRRGPALVDPADAAEADRTQVLVETSVTSMLLSLLLALARRPLGVAAAAGSAASMCWRARGRIGAHIGYFLLACRLGHLLRRAGIARLHAHFGTNPAAVALLCRRMWGIRYSLTLHGPEEMARPARLSLRQKIAAADLVIAISEHDRRTLAESCDDDSRLKLIRCGLDGHWLSSPPSPVPAARTLVCVARLDDQKNPLGLIDAAAKLRSADVDFALTIVGDGPLRARVAQRIAAAGLGRSVTLAGWCTQQQVERHLRDARALVLASRDEGLPVAIMEAFALGRVAIATDVGGVGELVRTGETGWLVNPGDPTALADAMRQCLDAPPAAIQTMADAARRRVGQNHDIRASAAQLSDALDSAPGGGSPAGLNR